MITNYTEYCIICGTPKTDDHHCVFGRGRRDLADKDNLIMPLCRKHHDFIHKGDAQTLSKIIGQLAFEKAYILENGVFPYKNMDERARESFRKRYGESYL